VDERLYKTTIRPNPRFEELDADGSGYLEDGEVPNRALQAGGVQQFFLTHLGGLARPP
jgi:hypothetical protein